MPTSSDFPLPDVAADQQWPSSRAGKGERRSRTSPMQSAELLQVLKQKAARLPADNMKRHAALFKPSEFDWSEAKLSGYGRDGCAGIGVIAR